MATEFKVPELGENVANADVADVLVAEGDTVEPGQMVLELETEKAVMPLPCSISGKVAKILVKNGETVAVGQAVLLIEETAGATKPETPPPAGDDGAKKSQPDKRSAAATATEEKREAPTAPQNGGRSPAFSSDDRPGAPLPAGPATRRLARELGVTLESVSGSGPGGRITQEDIARAYAGRNGSAGGVAAPPMPDFTQYGEVERQPLSKIARTTAQNLSVAWQVIPHVTQHDLADITELEAARRRFLEKAGKDGPKVTMTAVAIKASVAALKEFPHFNASLDTCRNELVYKRYYHIGVAVDTPNGLMVPVIRDADQKTILESPPN